MAWIFTNFLVSVCSIFLSTTPVFANEIIHRFESPTFGGNALNGGFLMNKAEAQNKFKDPSAVSGQKTQIEQFKESLQRSVLNRLATTSTASLVDSNGNIVLGSNLSFDLNGDGQSDFSVIVSDQAVNGNVKISISDGITDTELVVPVASN